MELRMNRTKLLKRMRQLKVGSQLGRMMLMKKRGACNMLKPNCSLIRPLCYRLLSKRSTSYQIFYNLCF